MRYETVATASQNVAATRRRTEKTALLAEVLEETPADLLAIVTSHLSGRLPQGKIGVGYSLLSEISPDPASQASLTVSAVHETLTAVQQTAGAGSRAAKRARLIDLFGHATEAEQRLLWGLLSGEVRQGALDGVMSEAIARAFSVDPAVVRRAAMLSGDLATVAVTAARDGDEGLGAFRLRVFQPLQPMLAATAESAAAGVAALGDAFVDWKLDGARVQVHYDGERVRAYTRNLRDVTSRLDELVAAVRALPVTSAVLDAEVISLRSDGRPRPFQETMSRFGRQRGDDGARNALPLTTFVFDALHLDGRDLIDEPLSVRSAALDPVLPEAMRVPRIRTTDGDEAEEFFAAALAAGHEGVMVKAAASLYAAGRRGAEWLKVKPAHTLDLVVLGVEWGSGRRRGWLSNLHLGAYDPDQDRFVMLGKTFKGLTDEMLEWQTTRFLELETHREGHVVWVRPEQVVEIAFDGVQESARYPEGMALRFARVKGYRGDKSAHEADTLAAVRSIHRREPSG